MNERANGPSEKARRLARAAKANTFSPDFTKTTNKRGKIVPLFYLSVLIFLTLNFIVLLVAIFNRGRRVVLKVLFLKTKLNLFTVNSPVEKHPTIISHSSTTPRLQFF